MKLNFSVYIKDGNGEYTIKIPNTNFPFSCSSLLDERLDEAVLYACANETALYNPTTEVKVVITDKDTNTTKEYHYIISSDTSTKIPISR